MMTKLTSMENLVKQTKRNYVWGITAFMLSMFNILLTIFFMWTIAAFGAIMFMMLAILFFGLQSTAIIRIETRRLKK